MKKNKLKIVLIGGPGTGKTAVLETLKKRGFFCLDEVSRAVTLEAQKQGIDQLFLSNPLLFSQKLLEGRENQFFNAQKSNSEYVFFNRGIPDVKAYLDYYKTEHPSLFLEKCKEYFYDVIFHFKPWNAIYTKDNERYESFDEAKQIDFFITKTYQNLGYTLIDVPFGTVNERVDFIINSLPSE